MMKDDTSLIPSSGCNVLTGTGTLSNYSNNIKTDFVFNGGRWYQYRTQTSNFAYDTSGFSCIDVSLLNSYEVYKPFLFGLAFLLFAFVLMLVFKTLKGFLHGI